MRTAGLALTLAITSVLAALVFVATAFFVVNIPATNGYFNIGETVIYTAALIFGPIVGAFAGGFGAALADVFVGAPLFAPGTLVIKAFEGGIVGYLNRRISFGGSEVKWKVFTILLGIIVGALLGISGAINYSGNLELNLGIATLSWYVQPEIWYALGSVVAALIILFGMRVDPESGRAIFSMIVGGLEMVIGYFLYETLILGKLASYLEIPANIGQMVIGLVVALPITRIVLHSLPQLNPRKTYRDQGKTKV